MYLVYKMILWTHTYNISLIKYGVHVDISHSLIKYLLITILHLEALHVYFSLRRHKDHKANSSQLASHILYII